MKLVGTKTDDGLSLAGLLVEASAKGAIIVHVHGMQGNFYEYAEPYAKAYAEKDIAFLTGENRGAYIIKQFDVAGGVKTIGGAYEVFEECVHDIKAWVDYAEQLGYTNIWLSGHSLGTMKVAYYMHKTKDPRVKGVILLSPADNQGLVRDPVGAADHAICYPEAQELQATGSGHQLLSHMLWGDKVLSADTYINLFSEESATNIFHYYDPSRSWEVVSSLSVPVIAFTGTKDDGIVPVIDPHQAMTMLEQRLTSVSRAKTLVLDGAEHSFVGYGNKIVDPVAEFISAS
jgi:pimeloyl-ACP methyl ester carboxylesterase